MLSLKIKTVYALELRRKVIVAMTLLSPGGRPNKRPGIKVYLIGWRGYLNLSGMKKQNNRPL